MAMQYFDKNMLIHTTFLEKANFFKKINKYVTTISHKLYNKGKWIIVEKYKNKTTAIKGHAKWIKKMTSSSLPLELKDVSDSTGFYLNNGSKQNGINFNKKNSIKMKKLEEFEKEFGIHFKDSKEKLQFVKEFIEEVWNEAYNQGVEDELEETEEIEKEYPNEYYL